MEARIVQAEEEDTAMQQYAHVRKTLQMEFKSFQNPIKKNLTIKYNSLKEDISDFQQA